MVSTLAVNWWVTNHSLSISKRMYHSHSIFFTNDFSPISFQTKYCDIPLELVLAEMSLCFAREFKWDATNYHQMLSVIWRLMCPKNFMFLGFVKHETLNNSVATLLPECWVRMLLRYWQLSRIILIYCDCIYIGRDKYSLAYTMVFRASTQNLSPAKIWQISHLFICRMTFI